MDLNGFRAKIRVVRFCIVSLVATSQNSTCFIPSGHWKNGNCIFYVETQKTLVTKVVGLTKMHILHQKWDHGSIVCYGTCTNHSHQARSPRELLPRSNYL
jgi:hypothetical protein